MNGSVIRNLSLSSVMLIVVSGCVSPEVAKETVTADTQRPVLIIKPVEYKKEVKPISVPTSTATSKSKVIDGKASYYANMFQGRKTANGQIFDQGKLTAAHRTLPFGTKVKVTNINNHKSVIVTINDRGPFIRGRIIDLSSSAFKAIGNPRTGVLNVTMEILK
ncbi:septal ring lytic transglycosylase RlpA family protein [Photobacterium carnosum]|uniref:Endolytic peptidoglycan transglycosylase RlpA n=2 Tax=Photobacterium carnosum TaxID=2023717 RepID=A0A2N4UQH1_9GAMM|nr:septal ring lytic transglycosylase RlpA family protein [Photobacterium carnosum]MCD9526174.1 septal ring lytic transglycosylase RlpA family protein [Photobacterium carnosum]MCD9531719.1 septal ring lytic transglycosylase RlpA family protein [Photobacterium carnosum]MCD9543496.1 septal ring lytic transglycosylase RlpA family protein [Photobacterium carnosum]MCD9550160.1 septal ring lytic transglycosylase RlpA family protein [Photobacterium carnosum]MCD9554880.1 septal ring lytic transglycosy